jgi:hypothetical protein
MGSSYRELESGVERHKRDIMGNDPRFDMNAEQKEVMGKLQQCTHRRRGRPLIELQCRQYIRAGVEVVIDRNRRSGERMPSTGWEDVGTVPNRNDRNR